MDDYNFLADMFTTFRSLPDIAKIIWLLCVALAPAITIFSIAKAIAVLRKPKPPGTLMFTFNSRDYGDIEIYRIGKAQEQNLAQGHSNS